MNLNPTSLKNRIAKASTENEIDQLLAEGKGYQFASDNTRCKWKKVAKLRIEELKHKVEKKVNNPENPDSSTKVVTAPADAKRKPGRPRKTKENVNG